VKTYTINNTPAQPLRSVDFNTAGQGTLTHIRPESSDHHPGVRFTFLHDTRNLYLQFTVNDRYVRVIHNGLQAPVYKDSCVEFFVKPKPDCGYFNFEFNAGGAMLANYIEDPTRTPAGFKKSTPLPAELCTKIEIIPSLPRTVNPEISDPLTWTLSLKISLTVMEPFTGPLTCTPGSIWRGNFYKCGDETSHPHWLSWSPVKELNFHAPECFGELQFRA